MYRLAVTLLVSFLSLLMPLAVQAHGFAQRYDLPVPLALYVGGAAAAVALSFVVIALVVRRQRTPDNYPRCNLLATWPGRLLASGVMVGILRAITVGLLMLVIIAGFTGNPDPFRNIAPTTVWVVWWVGLAYVSGLLGDLWAVINPWKTLFSVAAWLVKRVRPATPFGLQLAYPRWLGDWPAVLLFVWFVWAELVWPANWCGLPVMIRNSWRWPSVPTA